jgi:hypothetical protein
VRRRLDDKPVAPFALGECLAVGSVVAAELVDPTQRGSVSMRAAEQAFAASAGVPRRCHHPKRRAINL